MAIGGHYLKLNRLQELGIESLTALRLLSTDADKDLVSIENLADWIAGTANQLIVTDNGDGTITLSTPQNTHVDATPEFAGITIRDSSGSIIFYVDDDEMYFTASLAIPIEAGMPMGLLLALTYASP